MPEMDEQTGVTAAHAGVASCGNAPAGVKWIWFDLDDTLYDFASSSLIALRQVYDKYDLGRYFESMELWVDTYHRHNAALWRQYNAALITQQKLRFDRFYLPLQEGGMGDAENLRLNPVLDVDYLDMLGSTGLLLDGAKEALAHLRSRGYRIGILSNGFRGVQHEKLRTSGIAGQVDEVVLSDDINVNKPDRRIYDHALRLSEASAGETLMIGDNPDTDIAGAVRAGWKAMLYAPRHSAAVISVEGVEIPVLHHLEQLLNW